MRKTINIDFDNSSSILLGYNPDILGPNTTNYALSNHTHGNVVFSATNITAEATSVSNGLTIALSVADPSGVASNSVYAGDNITLSTAGINTTVSVYGLADESHDHGGVPSITGQIAGTIASNSWSLSIPNFMGTNTSTATITGTNVTLSGNTNGLTMGIPRMLTTAAQISHTHGNVTTFSTGGSDIKYTSLSNGLTLGIPQYLTTYGGGFAMTLDGNTSGTLASINSGTLTIAGGNNITLSQDGNAFTIIGVDQSTHEHSTLPYAGTNTSIGTISGTDLSLTLNTDGLSIEHPEWITTGINLSIGGNTSGTLSNISDDTVVLYGGNNITLSQDNNSITISGPNTSTYSAIKGIGVRDFGGGDYNTFTSGTVIFSEQTNINIQTYLDGVSQYLRFSVPDFVGTSTAATNMGITVNSDGIRVSVDTAGMSALGDGVNIIAAGTQTAASNATVVFQDGGGISFGMNNSSVVTAGYTQSTHEHPFAADNHSHGNASLSLDGISGTYSSASNGFTLSLTNSTHSHPYISTDYTSHTHTYADSNHSHGNVSLSLSNLSGTYSSASNGLTLSLTGVSTAPGDGVNILAAGGSTANSTGTILFSNANNLSFGFSNATAITGSFSQSTHSHETYADLSHTHGNVSLATTNISATASSLSNGLTISLSVGEIAGQTYQPIAFSGSNTSTTASTLSFGNLNDVSHYITNGSLVASFSQSTHSHDAGGVALKGSGTYSQNTGTVEFANSNSITFGLTNNQMTASFDYTQSTHEHPYQSTGDYLTTQFAQIVSASNGSYSFETLSLGSSEITFYTNASGIQGSYTHSTHEHSTLTFPYADTNHTHNFLGLDSTGVTGAYWTVNTSQYSLNIPQGSLNYIDANGVSWTGSTDGLSTSIYASVDVVGLGGVVGTSFSTVGTTGSVLQGSMNSNGLSLSIPAWITTASQSVQPAVISLNGSSGSVSISASTNITVSNDNGTIILIGPSGVSGSWELEGANTAGTTGSQFQTLFLSGGQNVTLEGSSNTIIFNVNATGAQDGGNVLAVSGSTASSTGTVAFWNANNISFGFSDSTRITASFSQSTHDHPYLNTSQSSLLQHTSATSAITSAALHTSQSSLLQHTSATSAITSNALHTSQSSLLQHTSATSAITSNALNTSQSNLFQLTADNSLSLGTIYTSHTHLYQSTGAYLTTQLNQAVSASNGSFSFQTLTLGSADVTFYTNASGVQGSYSQSTHEHSTLTFPYASSSHTHNYLGLESTGLTGAEWTVNTSQFSLNIPQGTLYFSDGSGIIWGSSVSSLSTTITGSVDAIGSTYTNHTHNYAGTGFSTTEVTGDVFVGTLDSNGLSLGVPLQITSIPDYAATSHTHGSISLSLSNLSGTYSSASDGLTLSLTGQSGGGGADGYNILAAGTQTANTTGTIVLSNSNGVSFGMSNSSIITADFNSSLFLQETDLGNIYFTNGSNVTWSSSTNGNSTSIFLTAGGGGGGGEWSAISTNAGTDIIISTATNTNTLYYPAFLTTVNEGSIYFVDANGVSFNSSVSSISTSIMASINAGAWELEGANTAGTTSATFNTLYLSGGNNVTLSGNSNTIIISVPAAGAADGGNILAVSGSTAESTGYVALWNANNFTFGFSDSTRITASFSQSTHDHPYVNTSQSSLLQHTSATSAITSVALHTSQSSLLQHTSATSAITSNALNTSQSSAFQLVANSTLSLGTEYTTHTHLYQSTGAYLTTQKDQVVSASNGSYTFETIMLGSSIVTFFTNASGVQGSYSQSTHEHPFLNTSQSSLLQHTSATSAITSNAFPSADTTKFAGTGTTFAGANISGSMTLNSIGLNLSLSGDAGGAGGTSIVPGDYLSSSLNGSTLSLSVTGLMALSETGSVYFVNASNTNLTFYSSTSSNSTSIYASAGGVVGDASVFFTNTNGVSFATSTNGSSTTVSASVETAYPRIWQLSGNTAGTSSSANFYSSSALRLHGGNNITLSGGSAGISIIGGAGGGGVAIADTATTITNNTVVFSNSNGLSFGLNGSTMTASINEGSIYFNDSNGVLFGSSVDGVSTSITASVTQSYVLSGNTSGTTAFTAGPNLTFVGSDNITIKADSDGKIAFVGGAGAGGGAALQGSGTYTQNTGTVQFQTGNGITFGLTAGSMTASHNAYSASSQLTGTFLTTAAQISHSHGNPTLSLSNLSGATASASNGLTISLTGHNSGYSASSQLTATFLTSQSNQAFSASGGSSAFQTLNFADSNGITFSNTNGSLRITHGLQYTSATSAITANALNTSVARIAAMGNTANSSAFTSGSVMISGANLTVNTSANGASQYLQISAPAIGYLYFSNANAHSWSSSVNGVSTSIYIVT